MATLVSGTRGIGRGRCPTGHGCTCERPLVPGRRPSCAQFWAKLGSGLCEGDRTGYKEI